MAIFLKNMKKVIIYVLVAVMFLPCKSQITELKKHEISLSAGVLPSTDSRMFIDILVAILTLGLVVPDDMVSYGSYSIGYNYHANEKWSYGFLTGFSANKTTYKSGYNDSDYKQESLRHYFYAMPTIKLTWLHRKRINLYSELGLGFYFRVEKITHFDDQGNDISHNNGGMAAVQLTPVGMELGNEKLKYFLDLGFGNKGLLNTGLRYKF